MLFKTKVFVQLSKLQVNVAVEDFDLIECSLEVYSFVKFEQKLYLSTLILTKGLF